MHACNVSPVAFLAGEPRISASGSIMRFRSGSIGPLSRFRGTPSPSIGCCVFRIDVCYRKLGTECGQTRSRKNGENNSNRVGTHERRWMALLAISAFWQLCGSFTAPLRSTSGPNTSIGRLALSVRRKSLVPYPTGAVSQRHTDCSILRLNPPASKFAAWGPENVADA